MLAVEVDRLAPVVRIAIGEVIGGELRQVIAVRAEMVVDDIEDHAEAGAVRGVDKMTEIVGSAVQMRRRPQIDAVISPAETARKLVHRHDLENRDSDVAQMLEMTLRRDPRPLLGERADEI